MIALPSPSTVILYLLWLLFRVIKTSELLLFASDSLNEQFPLELPLDATVQDLLDEIVRQRQLNTNMCSVAISFHGQPLNELDAQLADIGVSMQSVVNFQVTSFIKLELNTRGQPRPPRSARFKVNKTLLWNPNKDLSQFEWIRNPQICSVSIVFYENDVRQLTDRQFVYEDIARSHSFWIVDIVQTTQTVDFDIARDPCFRSLDLRYTEYARDIVISPTPNQTMALSVFRRGRSGLQPARYRFPAGYSLLLKNRKRDEYHAIIKFDLVRSADAQHPYTLSEEDRYFDTAEHFGAIKNIMNRAGYQYAFSLHDQYGACLNKIFWQRRCDPAYLCCLAKSHTFYIRPIEELQQDSDIQQLPPGWFVNDRLDLYNVQYAHDIALIADPEQGESLRLLCWTTRDHCTKLKIPDGYGLWLKYEAESSQQNLRVPLRLYRGSRHVVYPAYISYGDILEFDVNRDLTQFDDSFQDMDFIGVWSCDDHDDDAVGCKNIVYFQNGGDSVDSHLFRIKTTKQMRQQFGMNGTMDVFQHEDERLYPSDLRKPEYARDLAVTPKYGHSLRIFFQRDNNVAEYSLPSGYSMWLQYDADRVVTLQCIRGCSRPQSLRFDMETDLTQCEWQGEYTGVWTCDQHGVWRNIVYYKAGQERMYSHWILIVKNEKIRQQFAIGNEAVNPFRHEYQKLFPSELRKGQYAKNFVITATSGQTLRLFCDHQEYLIPTGYSVVLQHRNSHKKKKRRHGRNRWT